ncbi:MAG: DUF4954 domain-containing protein, partial [Bacteroidota bacterium]
STAVDILINNVKSGKINDWNAVHGYYEKYGSLYPEQKFQHAFASLLEILKLTPGKLDKPLLKKLLSDSVATKEWITKGIYDSRAKDYKNEFRRMVYDSREEMDKVLGKLEENSFINMQNEELKKFRKKINALIKSFGL